MRSPLGDRVARALEAVGVTKDRVSAWLGDCCCEERRQKLNQLDLWARRVISGKIGRAREYLERIIG